MQRSYFCTAKLSLVAMLTIVCSLSQFAAASSLARPGGHAPIGVMGDHMHHDGDIMLSYRYARMSMGGNRDGSKRLSAASVRAQFPIAPVDMDMEMHMFGAMWAPHDRVTLMAMLPLIRLDMKHRTRSGLSFTTRSNGIGDGKLIALIGLWKNQIHRIHFNAGLSLPTGSIRAKDNTPMGRVRLPYPMQLGSGTFDFLPGVTYVGHQGLYDWGAQLNATLRSGINSKGYRWGNRFGATAWLSRDITSWLSASARVAYSRWRSIRGDDDAQNRLMAPTADPHRRAGKRVDLLLGANIVLPMGWLRNHRLAIEVGRPIVQHLVGPQLETDWRFMLGWQYALPTKKSSAGHSHH